MGTEALATPDTDVDPADFVAEIDAEETPPAWVAVSRGVLFFLGLLALLSLLSELRQPGTHSDVWWLDLRCPAPVARAGLSLAAALLLAFAVRPTLPEPLRLLALALVACLLSVTLWRTFAFYSMLRVGTVRAELAIPFSLHAGACLIVALAGLRRRLPAGPLDGRGLWLFASGFLLCAVTFPVAQIYCIGSMDERRAADAVLVHTASDEGSAELAECMRTACGLIREGFADRLILADRRSGTDAEWIAAVRRRAVEHGIPEDRISVASETMTGKDSGVTGSRPILAVGQFYQLPRLRLMWSRSGREVCTVPVRDALPASELAWRIAGEVGALWSCHLRPFAK